MQSRHGRAAIAVITCLAASSALLATEPSQWRRARGRLSVLTSPTEVARLVSPLPAAGDELGRSVAVGPGVIVVGAPGNVLRESDLYPPGEAHVFVGGGGRWRHRQRLVAFDREFGDSFGRSMAVSGDTIAVGAEHDDHGDVANAGSVYVFVRTGRTWTLQQKLVAPDPRVEAHFGHSLALDGDRMVVGAEWRWSPTAQLTAGGASVFERVDQEWVHEQDFAASDPGSNDRFGSSVAIAGDMIVIGAPEDEDEAIESSGSAYVFTRIDGEWAELQKLVPCDPSPWQRFGWSVSVAGANLLVGSPWGGAGGVDVAGCAYLFRCSGGSWVPACVLSAGGAASWDLLGETAISGHTAVLGARLADVDGLTDAGAAHVFLLP